jgi:signal peptidase I
MTTDSAAAEPSAGKSALGEAWELGKTLVYALLLALALRIFLFQPFTIPSASMEPTLYEGDYIIVSKFSYGWSKNSIPFSPPIGHGRLFGREPTRGDVIVFKLPRDGHVDYIKRLIGLPGDQIQVKESVVYINGKVVPRTQLPSGPASSPYGTIQTAERYRETLPNGRSYVTNDFGPMGGADNTAVYTVPKGCYFMMGDNRDDSVDSRFNPGLSADSFVNTACRWDSSVDSKVASDLGVGFVPAENLVGKAQLVLLSWSPGVALVKPWTWFTKARPSRWFHPIH